MPTLVTNQNKKVENYGYWGKMGARFRFSRVFRLFEV